MRINIKGEPKEIAALVAVIQEQRNVTIEMRKPKFVPETADGPCSSGQTVTACS